ncbi:MAG: universal stress protein [Acidobacteriia bacterium]|nr:universal stress protein [Terriglobia bacterium]
MYKNILLPTDGSELSAKAVEHGITLAKTLGAKITVLMVTAPFRTFSLEPPVVVDSTADEYTKHMKDRAAKATEAVAITARAAGVQADTAQVEDEHPYQAIIDTAAKKGCDLVVMASHGRRGVAAVVLGSETVKVLTHSTVPVLVYR